ncbi:MAG: LEA type 2 family protein [Granulosicoccus sp.]|nr:LEA type 2 family protein [Granulosicoccus sp.]
MKQINRQLTSLLLLSAAVILNGCSSIPTHKPVAPVVKLESVEPVDVGIRELVLAFQLNVFNPNQFSLPIDDLEFSANYKGETLAQASRSERVLLAAESEQLVNINVTTKWTRVIRQILEATASGENQLAIDINGSVKLGNWPARLPFSVERRVHNPLVDE